VAAHGATTEQTPLPVEVVAVFGPTASGKSRVADALAARLGTEIVSADALQVYRGIPIVTNQSEPSVRLVAIRELTEEMSLGEYAALAHAEIDALVEARGTAVVSGGTGLYLRAAIHDLRIPPAPAPEVREAVERETARDLAAAHRRLAELDPVAAKRIHPHDRRRVVRALELALCGSSLVPEQDALWSAETRRPTLVVGLRLDAETLERRIRDRAAGVLAAGGAAEARRALAGPISRTAEKALGLRELAELSEEEALERLVTRTRRYAAYQRKWMRRIPGLVELDADRGPTEIAEDIVARIRVHSSTDRTPGGEHLDADHLPGE
jgi:tRNA dimethylallyltransferase